MLRINLAGWIIFSVFLYLQVNAGETIKEDHLVPSAGLAQTVEICGEKFYFGSGDYVTWLVAEEKCAARGMQLVTLSSRERNDKIFDWIKKNQAYDYWYWGSGRKARGTSQWQWSTTGEAITFSNWGVGQPSRRPEDESCLSFSAVFYRGWDDDMCDGWRWSYICEEVRPSCGREEL